MSYLILAICAGITVAFFLKAWHELAFEEQDPEAESQRRILAELRDIERHRPNHIINNQKEES